MLLRSTMQIVASAQTHCTRICKWYLQLALFFLRLFGLCSCVKDFKTCIQGNIPQDWVTAQWDTMFAWPGSFITARQTNTHRVYFVVQTTADEYLPTRRWRNTICDPFSLESSLVTLRGECGRLRWASTHSWPRSEHVGVIRPSSCPSGNF